MFDDNFDLNNQDLESTSNFEKSSWEFVSLEEVKPQYKEQESFKVVLAQGFTTLGSHLTDTNSHLTNQEMFF